ncbi:transposase family protein [Streptomyces roseus]|uniref:transposase family protein n=1 Tax=Streptomyces roseus TaxID=66430 RepID=UPI0038035605
MGDEQGLWDLVWPDVDGIVADEVGVAEGTVTIDAHAGQRAVRCPSCGESTLRVHSTYKRRLADRPIGGRRVVLRLMVRRFFCDNAACKRRTLAE